MPRFVALRTYLYEYHSTSTRICYILESLAQWNKADCEPLDRLKTHLEKGTDEVCPQIPTGTFHDRSLSRDTYFRAIRC